MHPFRDQEELEFYTYYGYGPYWLGPGVWGDAAAARELRPMPRDRVRAAEERVESQQGDPHLRSTREVTGSTSPLRTGRLATFVLDENAWIVRHIVVDTSNWPGGRSVLLPREWVRSIDWSREEVHVKATVQQIKSGPEYRATELLR